MRSLTCDICGLTFNDYPECQFTNGEASKLYELKTILDVIDSKYISEKHGTFDGCIVCHRCFKSRFETRRGDV